MTRPFRFVVGVLSAGYLALFLGLALARAAYPFELEWQEGGMLEHVLRVRAGEPIYAAPTLEFVAFPYTPLYYWVSAAATGVAGESFLALRLVSIASALACFGLLFHLAARSGGGKLGGLASAGLFAACYRFGGAWLDVGRVDSLALGLTLGALAALRVGGVRAAFAGGALFVAAVLTKQSTLGVALAVVPAVVLRDRRSGVVYVATLVLLGGALAGWLEHASGGWFRWYVIDLLRAENPVYRPLVLGFWRELALQLGPAAVVVVLGARSGASAPGWAVLASAALGMLVVSWVSRMHIGGYDNTRLPACAAIALLFGPALARATGSARGVALAAGLLATFQFLWLWYDPGAQLPTAADRVAGERVVDELAEIDGEVLVPFHGYLARRAGKRPGAHAMAVHDLLRGPDTDVAGRFVAELEGALGARRFAAIVLDDPSWEEELPALREHYVLSGRMFAEDDLVTFFPVTGAHSRPERVLVPR